MKFNHLRASVANNSGEKPTLYMALCMVESLFLDMEDESGKELSHCPGGDERLPSKLVWLCRAINEIYKDHDEDLQRNRTRLDAAVEKMNKTRQELESLSAVATQLAALEEEADRLERELQTRNADARRCEELTMRCAAEKQRLEELSHFDPALAEGELKRLSQSVAQKEAARAELTARLEQARSFAAQASQEEAQSREALQAAQSRLAELEAACEKVRSEGADLLTACQQLEETLSEEKKNQERLLISKQTLTAQVEELEQKRAELTALQNDLKGLEERRNALEVEREALEKERNERILDIAHRKTDNQTQSEKLLASQSKLEQLRQEREKLNGALTGCLQELDLLQAEVERLEKQRLPEAEALREQERQRRETLQERAEQCQTQCASFQAEAKKLEQRLPQLEEALRNERVVYDALTASCTAKSRELESLERQNAELRSNNDEEKLVIYRKQLEETQSRLEQVRQECEQVEQENTRMQKQLEEGQTERARLLELKRRHESGMEVTARQLQELAFAGADSYVREITELEERAKLLENVRSKLAASVANMRRILGNAPVEEKVSLENQLRYSLQGLRLRLEEMRRTIVDCAKSVNMEER